MKKLALFAFLCSSLVGSAQDNCGTAISLGTLGNPGACGSGVKVGTVKTVTGTLTGATPENPYVTEGPCSGGTMASPAKTTPYAG